MSFPESHLRRKQVCVIHNPTAGQGTERFLHRCLDRLRDLGVEYDLVATQSPGHARTLAREKSLNPIYDAIVVAGGDGSLNEAADGLLGHSTPLGIIPTGTANVLAAEIGLAQDPVAVARSIAYGSAKPVFPGMLNEKGFLLMVSAGFDARSIKYLPARLKPVLGKGAYFISALRELLRYNPPRLSVSIGEEVHQANWIIVSRCRYYAGKFVLGADTNLENQDYAVTIFQCQNRMELIAVLWRLIQTRFMDNIMKPIVTRKRIVIESLDPEPLQVDGDPAGNSPATITASAISLNLIWPLA